LDEIVYETIAEIADPAIARVLVAALRGYGFHPLARDVDGPPGMPGYTGTTGLPVEVPASEAADARVLAGALLTDMQAGRKSAT
jgi:hypothetical protein